MAASAPLSICSTIHIALSFSLLTEAEKHRGALDVVHGG
jgi:hypothetical protein